MTWDRNGLLAADALSLLLSQTGARSAQLLSVDAARRRLAATIHRACLLHDACSQRAAGTRLVIARLVELGAVNAENAARAADTLYALTGPEVYLSLTRDRQWSSDDYERWLASALTAQLPA